MRIAIIYYPELDKDIVETIKTNLPIAEIKLIVQKQYTGVDLSKFNLDEIVLTSEKQLSEAIKDGGWIPNIWINQTPDIKKIPNAVEIANIMQQCYSEDDIA